MKKLFIFVFFFLSIGVTSAFEDEQVMCTMDAMQCSDGSWVGRSGPNCEFACPGNEGLKKMHPSWDEDKDGINDCEKEGNCDDSIDYTQPKPQIVDVYGNHVPMSCSSWFDGCNTCMVGENGVLGCTKMYCDQPSQAYCKTSHKAEEDAIMCTMQYDPVCGNDGKTYGNACSAQKVGTKYNGICIGNTLETKLQKDWTIAVEKALSNSSAVRAATLLERAISRAQTIALRYSFESIKQGAYNFVSVLAQKTLQSSIYEKYLKANISNISPVDPVLGGTWYITKIEWLDKNKALIEYEDGHIMETITIEIRVVNNSIQVVVQE